MIEQAVPEPGSKITLTVTDFNTDGGSVARMPLESGSVVFFLDRGIIGETVLAEVTRQRKRHFEARVLETVSPSPDAAEPFCEYFGQCGGCTMQNYAYDAQLAWKRKRVGDALARLGRYRGEVPAVLPSPRQTGFRSKMEYAFGQAPVDSARRTVLGLRGRRSHLVFSLRGCPLQKEGSGAILETVEAWAATHGLSAWDGLKGQLRYFVLREPEYQANHEDMNGGTARMAELICGGDLPPAEALDELNGELTRLGVVSFTVSSRKSSLAQARGERVVKSYGLRVMREQFDDMLLEFPPQAFMQSNTGAASLIYRAARELAGLTGGETVWDIYSGVGALALYVGRDAGPGGRVLGLELDKAAVWAAKNNAAGMGLKNASFMAGEAASLFGGLKGRPDLLLLDPPRGGLSPRLIPAIIEKAPAGIVYVSCDPASLARDLSALSGHYRASGLSIVDMFPHTPHVESVMRLDRIA